MISLSLIRLTIHPSKSASSFLAKYISSDIQTGSHNALGSGSGGFYTAKTHSVARCGIQQAHRSKRCHPLLDMAEPAAKDMTAPGAKFFLKKSRPRLMVFKFLNRDSHIFNSVLIREHMPVPYLSNPFAFINENGFPVL